MFTGLIESVGEVAAIKREPSLAEITIRTGPALADALVLGDSLAVRGICLTITRKQPDRVAVQAMLETMERTSLRHWRPGLPVNLERALALNGRLNGHMVTGHVDAAEKILRIQAQGEVRILEVGLPGDLAKFVAVKGSIAVDGVSLTVTAVAPASFSVSCIPHTLAHTSLGQARAGDLVNIEVDVLARYLDRLQSAAAAGGTLTLEKLEMLGF